MKNRESHRDADSEPRDVYPSAPDHRFSRGGEIPFRRGRELT